MQEHEIRAAMDKQLSYGLSLAENKDLLLSEKGKICMGDLVEGIEDPYKLAFTAAMAENLRKEIAGMTEITRMADIGDFEKWAFPIVGTIAPSLIHHELVSVQPLDGPVSQVFYLRYLYNLSKSGATAGQAIWDNVHEEYASEDTIESIGTGDAVTVAFSPTLSLFPVRPNTLTVTSITAGAVALNVTDTGAGAFAGDETGAGTINYLTGAITNLTFTTAPGNGEDIQADYTYNNEGNDLIPEIDVTLSSSPVECRTDKLATRWSLEAKQDMQAKHGRLVDVELATVLGQELKFELDTRIINHLINIAALSVAAFSTARPAGISLHDHYRSFEVRLAEARMAVYTATQRFVPTWMVMGTNVVPVMEALPGFVSSGEKPTGRGVYFAGTYRGMRCFVSAAIAAGTYIVGFQGANMMETGYIFAPYILFATEQVKTVPFVDRKAVMARTARKLVDANFFCTGTVT